MTLEKEFWDEIVSLIFSISFTLLLLFVFLFFYYAALWVKYFPFFTVKLTEPMDITWFNEYITNKQTIST